MKFKIQYADQIVGIFSILAVFCLSVLLIFMGINQRWFQKNYYFNTRFLSAEQLNIGKPIKLKGFEIGQIKKINLTEDNNVEVEFYIYEKFYEKIKPNSIIQHVISPIGIGSELVIHPGNFIGDPLEENSFIPSYNLEEARELIKKGVVDIPQGENTVTRIINQIDPILANVNLVLASFNELSNTVNTALRGELEGPVGDTIDNVASMTSNIKIIIAETTNRINVLLDNFEGITGNVNTLTANPDGLIPRLMGEDGSAAALFNDNRELYNNLNSILANLDKMTQELNTFTAYLNDSTPQITGVLEESRGALKEGKAVLEGLKNNPLLKGGITELQGQDNTFNNYRDEDF